MASTPLSRAIFDRDLLLLRSLLRSVNRPNLEEMDLGGDTALHAAGRCGYDTALEMAQELVRAGANINATNRFHETPLDTSIFYEMRFLIDGYYDASRSCGEVANFLATHGALRRQDETQNELWERISRQAGRDTVNSGRDVETARAAARGRGSARAERYEEREILVDSLPLAREVEESHFDNGYPLRHLVYDLIGGQCSPSAHFLRLRCVMHSDGRLVCRNNRRLWCLKQFQEKMRGRLEVKVRVIVMRKRRLKRRAERRQVGELRSGFCSIPPRPTRPCPAETAEVKDRCAPFGAVCSAFFVQCAGNACRGSSVNLWRMRDPDDAEAQADLKDHEVLEEASPSPQVFEVEDSQELTATVPWQRFAVKFFLTLTVFLIITLLLEIFAKDQVTAFSKTIIDSIGMPGLFVAVLIGDGLPQPFTYVPLIFLAVKAQVPKSLVFGVCASGSYLAAVGGYGAGFSLAKTSCFQQGLQRLAESQPWLPDLMQRKGALGVAIAALLPIPLALATWTAGSFRVNFPQFLISAAFRMPKILVFVLLSGWTTEKELE
ncbi:unnamed protein product [Durusdinium trenchii]|uniref:Uncharacterized protein n=1 Tax=Durusdinium trenchii TaxID=1381693 RepID=A0ABP0I5Y2_9DINO